MPVTLGRFAMHAILPISVRQTVMLADAPDGLPALSSHSPLQQPCAGRHVTYRGGGSTRPGDGGVGGGGGDGGRSAGRPACRRPLALVGRRLGGATTAAGPSQRRQQGTGHLQHAERGHQVRHDTPGSAGSTPGHGLHRPALRNQMPR